jgi:hypothetical protein
MPKKLSRAICLSVIVAIASCKPESKAPQPPPIPRAEIGEHVKGYQTYAEIGDTLGRWQSIASELAEVGAYGRTDDGEECLYIKLGNKRLRQERKILVTACIHGNEPLATSTVMAYAGRLLHNYGRNPRITALLDRTAVYFVPVVSPDSYPYNRKVGGVDPNRDFPTPKYPDKTSVTPVMNIRNFFLEIQPDSVLSGHTFGRVYLIPWGDNNGKDELDEEYRRITKGMCELSGYNTLRVSQLYGHPIYGTENDWYCRNGAFSIVAEFGTHQKKPTLADTEKEFGMTYEAFVFFLEESTEVGKK